MPSEDTIVDRLGDIPLLNDGWTSAVDYYTKVKDYNSVTKFTLGIAETSVKKAAEISTPVVETCKPQLDRVNVFACNKLDAIESKYPLIKQPSGEVKDACIEYYVQPVVDRVKPVVQGVQNVVTTGKNKVENLKTTSTKLVTSARDISVGTVTGAVNMTLATPPGRLLTRTMDGALNIADGLVDKYIPEEEHECSDEEFMDATNGDAGEGFDNEEVSEVPQMEVMEPSPERVVVHFRSVSNKIRKRMFQRAMRDYQGAKARTVDALGKLTDHVNLIDYAKTHFGTAKDKVEDVWGKIVAEEKENVEKENAVSEAGILEDRIISIGRVLVQQVRTGVQTMEKAAQEAGQIIKSPVTKTKEYKDLVIQFSSTHSLCNMSKASLESIRTNITAVRKNLLAMLDGFQAPSWLTLNVEIDGFRLDEEDDEAINASLRQQEVVRNHVDE